MKTTCASPNHCSRRCVSRLCRCSPPDSATPTTNKSELAMESESRRRRRSGKWRAKLLFRAFHTSDCTTKWLAKRSSIVTNDGEYSRQSQPAGAIATRNRFDDDDDDQRHFGESQTMQQWNAIISARVCVCYVGWHEDKGNATKQERTDLFRIRIDQIRTKSLFAFSRLGLIFGSLEVRRYSLDFAQYLLPHRRTRFTCFVEMFARLRKEEQNI